MELYKKLIIKIIKTFFKEVSQLMKILKLFCLKLAIVTVPVQLKLTYKKKLSLLNNNAKNNSIVYSIIFSKTSIHLFNDAKLPMQQKTT